VSISKDLREKGLSKQEASTLCSSATEKNHCQLTIPPVPVEEILAGKEREWYQNLTGRDPSARSEEDEASSSAEEK
jgi:hypothetical protein